MRPVPAARTVQKRDRGGDGRSCSTRLTDRSRATSHRAAGATGRDHGVAGPSTAAGSGDGRALVILFVVVVRFLRSGAGSRARSLRTVARGPRAT